MNAHVTLSPQDFTNIHNGLCQVRESLRRLEDVLHPSMAKELRRGVSSIERGMTSAYRQDNDDHLRRHLHYDDVRRSLNLESIWSINSVSDLMAPHPWDGATTINYHSSGGAISEPISGSAWVDLYQAANRCILRSQDLHHVYIEDLMPRKDNAQVLELTTGS